MDETVTVEDGATIVTLNEDNFGKYYYNAGDKTLMRSSTEAIVTFNPNGGALKEKKLSVKLTRQAQKKQVLRCQHSSSCA